jgi:hypothetical protein
MMAAGAGLTLTRFAAAQTLDPPEGRVLLRLTGKIERTNDGDSAVFDRAMLNDLPWQTLETYTDWTDGLQTFEGPLLGDLLEHVGAHGDKLHATALNGYAANIPVSDVEEYPVLLALRRNGEAMSVREKGPIWIIYPNPEPSSDTPGPHNDKSVWQLSDIDVR